MKVLVACEFSGVVRDAFANRGHDAWSCDLLPTESEQTKEEGKHIQGDVLEILNDGWDLMIAHPPCTYLCVPGAHYLHTRPERWNLMTQARAFFIALFNADIEKVCVENPVSHKYAELPHYNQIIHPWMFGDEYSKRTALWLKNLPALLPTKIVSKGERYIRKDGSVSNSKWYAKSSAHERSITFPGIAKAMAEQWG